MPNYVADRQVIEGILDYLNDNVDFTNFDCNKIELEALTEKTPSIALFTETGSVKNVINIIGDWDCAFRFRIDFKGDGDDTADRLSLSEPLNYLANFWEQKTVEGLTGLDIGLGRTPIKAEMITIPSKVAVMPDNSQIFTAFYQLLYREKRIK